MSANKSNPTSEKDKQSKKRRNDKNCSSSPNLQLLIQSLSHPSQAIVRGRQKSNKKQKRKVSAENKTLSNDVFTWQKHQRFVVSKRNGIEDTLTENVDDDK